MGTSPAFSATATFSEEVHRLKYYLYKFSEETIWYLKLQQFKQARWRITSPSRTTLRDISSRNQMAFKICIDLSKLVTTTGLSLI